MPRHVSLIAALLLFASSAASTPSPKYKNEIGLSQICDFEIDFSERSETSRWRPVLDGVMGGKSTGTGFKEKNYVTFKGRINTNGGGFSSLRRSLEPGKLSGAKNLNLRLRQDGRSYRLTFRTSHSYWGRPVSYQLTIPQTPKNVWTDISIPLSNFRTSIFGRRVQAPPFDPNDAWEMGIIIADGIDGPFEINISSIACT